MTTYEYRSDSPAATARLACLLAERLGPGAVVTLDGELGAGKTTFSQAVGRALGVQDVINSPTFTIIKEYEGRSLPFYHMDVYRLSPGDADELGLDDYFYGAGVTLIEWASLIEELLPAEHLAIRIEHAANDARRFLLTPNGRLYEEWCASWKEIGCLQ